MTEWIANVGFTDLFWFALFSLSLLIAVANIGGRLIPRIGNQRFARRGIAFAACLMVCLIAAQAILEGMSVVTADPKLAEFGASLIW